MSVYYFQFSVNLVILKTINLNTNKTETTKISENRIGKCKISISSQSPAILSSPEPDCITVNLVNCLLISFTFLYAVNFNIWELITTVLDAMGVAMCNTSINSHFKKILMTVT
jgi:hypothetical protein